MAIAQYVDVKSEFYSQIFHTLSELNKSSAVAVNELYNELIWKNKTIKIEDKAVFTQKRYNKRIIFIKHLYDQ